MYLNFSKFAKVKAEILLQYVQNLIAKLGQTTNWVFARKSRDNISDHTNVLHAILLTVDTNRNLEYIPEWTVVDVQNYVGLFL